MWLLAAKKRFSTMFLAVVAGLFWACFGGLATFWGYLFTLTYRRVMYQCWRLLFSACVGGSGEQEGKVCA